MMSADRDVVAEFMDTQQFTCLNQSKPELIVDIQTLT
jgi:hypothetical protein